MSASASPEICALANCKERMDEYLKYCGTANTIGVPFRVITPAEIKELWPLCETSDLVGALYHPDDGYINPADLTMAFAKGARASGAAIYQKTEVTAIERKGGEWLIKTNKGDIRCEHVVCATGNYARQTGKMVGLEIPAIPVQHQYIVTDEVPELREFKDKADTTSPSCANPTPPTICARSARDGFSAPMKKARPRFLPTAFPQTSARTCSPATWSA